MRQFSETAKDSLRDSIRYTVDFLDKNLSPERKDLFGETVIQALRDYYLMKKGSFLTGSVGLLFDEFGIPIQVKTRETILKLEKSLRNEEDYLEFTASLDIGDLREIMAVLRETVK